MDIVKRDMKYLVSYNNAITSICKEEKYLSNSTGYELELIKSNLEKRIERDLPQFFIIHNDDEVVGWCDITPNPKEYFKHVGTLWIGIIKEFRSKGLGLKILNITLDYAKSKNIEKVELEVYESNNRAINLYKKVGFEIEGIKKRGKKVNGVYEDVYLMAKQLN